MTPLQMIKKADRCEVWFTGFDGEFEIRVTKAEARKLIKIYDFPARKDGLDEQCIELRAGVAILWIDC